MWNSKLAGPLIGAVGVIIAALIATMGSGGGGGADKPAVVYVPTPPPVAGPPANVHPVSVQPANVQPANVQPANVQPASVQPANVQPVQPETPVQPPAVAKIQFRVHNVITPGMLKETVLVYIDDELKGTLTLDQRNPEATIKITVPKAGSYRYRLDIGVQYYDQFGDLDDDTGTGRGTITVADGDQFDVALEGTIDAPVILLQKR